MFRTLTIVFARVPLYATGIASLVAGGWLRRHCFRMLGESFTYDVRVRDGQAIVERGAYRYVRHPSYTAGLLLFGGIGLALTNWLSLAATIVLPAAAYAYRISVEERALVETLGSPYVDYMKRTRRLIPFAL
jgi:protein-S-isoprenylcysteine O-methyltransferase Ste14